jgi:extradiol dioxygenase family protein
LEGRLVKSVKAEPASRPSVHVSIDVPDLGAGLRFYGEVFGFVETARPFPTMAILDANNLSVCMHEKAAGSNSSSAVREDRRRVATFALSFEHGRPHIDARPFRAEARRPTSLV